MFFFYLCIILYNFYLCIIFLQGLDSSVSTILFYALELHVIPPHVPCSGSRYRIFTHHGDLGGLLVWCK